MDALLADKKPEDGEILVTGATGGVGSVAVAILSRLGFTVAAVNVPTLSSEYNNPKGVPISAIIFGGRRSHLIPLVCEAPTWQAGVFMGARTGSETTAAAIGKEGVLRRDPMAMLPFCGYNMGDYFNHWLNVGKKMVNPPKIFSVNWFRVNEEGRFIWPGFGDNIRALKWILDRVENKVDALKTPVGLVPHEKDIDLPRFCFSSLHLCIRCVCSRENV